MEPISLATVASSAQTVLQNAQAILERPSVFALSEAEWHDRDVPKGISISAVSFGPGGLNKIELAYCT